VRWLCYLTLACSLVAVTVSICTWQQADDRANAALRRKEKALVEKYRPAIERICKDFDIPGPPAESESLDALMDPIHRLVVNLAK